MAGPLAGIRVVDLSSMLSGPWAADILGDQGADVVQVEPPGTGDHVRSLPNHSGGLPAMFVNINRSKRSLTLNLNSADGVRTLLRLFATADVVMQNLRPGVVERLDIGYEAARAANPRIVYLSISGFWENGPYADRRVTCASTTWTSSPCAPIPPSTPTTCAPRTSSTASTPGVS